jgi:acyl-CoA thioesterase-1
MRRRLFLLALAATGCAKKEQNEPGSARLPATPSPAPPVAAPPVDNRPVIVAFGDSLTAGHGLDPGQSYPDVLQKQLDRLGLSYRVVNQGISGDTSDGGVARMSQALALHPVVVILELGANDGLRGLPLDSTRANLFHLTDAFQQAGASVLLAGMTLPRNYGPDYIHGFEQIYRDLAREKKTGVIPFLLDGVATRPELMQADALHPNAAGTRIVTQNVLRHLLPMLRKRSS